MTTLLYHYQRVWTRYNTETQTIII